MLTEVQKNSILTSLEKIEQLDLAQLVSRSANFTPYSSEQFVSLVKRTVVQLKEEINNGLGYFLPAFANSPNELGSIQLEVELSNFISYLQSPSHHAHATTSLNKLIYYQIEFGFWDKSQRKIHNANDLKAKTISDQLKALELTINRKISEIEKEKENLVALVELKKTELQQIKTNLDSSTKNDSQVATLLLQSTENNEKINSLLSQQNEKFEETKKNIETYKKEYNDLKNDIDNLVSDVNGRLNHFKNQEFAIDEVLKAVESKKVYFDERNTYLDTLIGKEVGANLFETFKKRKEELEKTVYLWAAAVVFAVILLTWWVNLLFKDLNGDEIVRNWPIVLVSTLKTLPIIFLLYFVINQFRKERNFQEEYAFKSAVALTLVEYSKQLNKADNKDKLILDSVDKIFNSPIPGKEVKKETDPATVIEAVKGVKDAIVESIKTINK